VWLGAHVGIADGLDEAARTGKRIGCESIQIFSKSPQMWAGAAIPVEAAEGFRAAVLAEGLRAPTVHHGYLANLASPKKAMLARSRKAFLDELQRAELLGVENLIFHPGASLDGGPEAGVKTLVASLDAAFRAVPDGRVRVLLENAAGQGTAMGSTFEQLAEVLGRLADPARAGVAIDTCHLFASGVDFRTEADYGSMVDRLAATVGLERVRAFHLNDAKAELGSHLDRHENIGKGQLGLDGFRHLVNDPRWAGVPGYLETPLTEDDYAAYVADLAALRALVTGVAAEAPRREGRPRRPSP
jgi:deoxyribonuclease IV